MKFLPSSSSCSSSSSFSAAFDANMCSPKNPVSGCLSGIFRRILCSGSLPTHPSDHLPEEQEEPIQIQSEKHQDTASNQSVETPATPGLVARLMGLESMNLADTKSAPNSISRSRSMNSVDPLCRENHAQQRLIRSALSFRETPTYLQMEDEEFFILSFENVSERSREFRSKGKRRGMGRAEFKQRSEEKGKSGEGKTEKPLEKSMSQKEVREEPEPRRVLKDLNQKEKQSRRVSNGSTLEVMINFTVLSSTSPPPSKHSNERTKVAIETVQLSSKSTNRKGVSNGRKSTKGQRTSHSATKGVETECCSEVWSPVSVLDCAQFLADPEVQTSEEDLSSGSPSPRRKIIPEGENHGHPSPRKDENLIRHQQNPNEEEETRGRSRKTQCHSQSYRDIWEEISRVTEADLVQSEWICRGNSIKLGDFEGIRLDLESYLLDKLLVEFVDQIAGIPSKASNS